MDSLGIVLFTSTKGHYGRKDIYKTTVESILNQLKGIGGINLSLNAHIKWGHGEDNEADEIADYLENIGFYVMDTKGDWNHNDSSHATGYTSDIIKAFSSPYVLKSQYSLWLEDDWVLQGDVKKFVYNSISVLNCQPNKLCVRANNQEPKEYTYSHNRIDSIFEQKENYTPWGPTFTFQPTIVRSRDVHIAYRLIRDNWEQLKNQHIELTSGIAMKTLSDDSRPFCFVDPKVCHSVHIGEFPFEKILEQ